MRTLELLGGSRGIRNATAALLSLLLFACGGQEETDLAEAHQNDTVLNAILESAAESPPASRGTSPRLPDAGQEARPTSIADMGYNFGDPDARVKVLEISDFGCGVCRRFHLETFAALSSIYMDGGYVEWKFIPFVLGRFPNALEAAVAAECAGEQDKFHPIQGRLFGDQSGWRNTDDPSAFFSDLASQEGLDVERFNNCIAGGWRDENVRQNIRLGQQVGTRGTPMFLVDGMQIPGALPLEEFRSVLDAALLRKGVTPPPGG